MTVARACLDARRPFDKGRDGLALEQRIERCVDAKSTAHHKYASALGCLPNRIDEVLRRCRYSRGWCGHHRLELCPLGSVASNEPLLGHAAADEVAASLASVREPHRIVEWRRLRESGQGSGFDERKVRRRFAKIVARRCLDAEPPVAEIDLIEVALEDLIFGAVLFHLSRRRLLAQLARQTHVAAVDD